MNISLPKTTFNVDEEIESNIDLSLRGENNKTYYLEGAFKKGADGNYFGLSWNDSDWIDYTANNYTFLKQIITDGSGKWSGELKVKLNPDSNLFTGSGNYTFQVKRFTSSGSSNWSDNTITVTIIPDLTPTPSASVSSTMTPLTTNTPTPISTPAPPSVLFEIINIPDEINSNQSITPTINMLLPNNPNTSFYLKGAFRSISGTNYFGLTKVNSNWIKNSDTYVNQYQITTDSSGHWSGQLDIQPDVTDSGYTGSGQYSFKIARYSNSGSGPVWSNEVLVNIQANTPSPIALPSVNINVSNTPTPTTNIQLNNLDTQSLTPLNLPSQLSSAESYLSSDSPQIATVAGQSISVLQNTEPPTNTLKYFLIISGVLIIIGNLGWYLRIHWKKLKYTPVIIKTWIRALKLLIQQLRHNN